MLAAASHKLVMEQMICNNSESVYHMTESGPVLLVFLRHFGCTFCREALDDIARHRPEIEAMGVRVVFVHMSENALAERYFNRYNLEGVPHVSDPDCRFYAAFGLVKGNSTQLFGLQSWIRGFDSAILHARGFGPQMGDGFQMPGVFVLYEGKIMESFIHELSHDRPDYLSLLSCCSLPA
jgi:AhpC/TSA family